MTNTIEIKTATRRAVVPATVFIRAFRRTSRTVAGQAVISMLHAWGTASANAAYGQLVNASNETLTLVGAGRS